MLLPQTAPEQLLAFAVLLRRILSKATSLLRVANYLLLCAG
jgi:hypothetical protein